MARLPRVTQQIFASLAANNGVFGSAQAGTPTTSADIAVLMAEPAYLQGWLDATLGASKFPPLEEFQALDFINTQQLAYLFQEGIPEWDTDTTYWTDNIVKAPGTLKIYGSLTNSNSGNDPTSDIVNWKLLADWDEGNRTRLTGDTTFYVTTTGNDSNPGTVGSPWLTLQNAVNYIADNVDLNGYNVTVDVGNGTYAAGAIVSAPWVGKGTVTFDGDTTTPANVIISGGSSDCFAAGGNGARLHVKGFKVQGTTGHGVAAYYGGEVFISGKMDFGAFTVSGGTGGHMAAFDNGTIFIATATYNITGGGDYHHLATRDGQISSSGSPFTATLTGTPAFGIFAGCFGKSLLELGGDTYSGSATGQRYNVDRVSVINTAGGGASYFPGNAGGAAGANGGYYV